MDATRTAGRRRAGWRACVRIAVLAVTLAVLAGIAPAHPDMASGRLLSFAWDVASFALVPLVAAHVSVGRSLGLPYAILAASALAVQAGMTWAALAHVSPVGAEGVDPWTVASVAFGSTVLATVPRVSDGRDTCAAP